MEKYVGFILMLDVSDSMSSAMPQVKINSNAFLGQGIAGDQFAVNAFSNDAFWVYPTSAASNILDVSDTTILAAKTEIEKLTTRALTNITDAIRLGNNMIAKASTEIKAFVLLSDGIHNIGTPAPDQVLGTEPPIYIAGMGNCRESNFVTMINKNPRSQFFYKPRSYEMMLMFNQIRAESTSGSLSANALHATSGSYYTLDEFYLTSSSNAQVCITWTDKSFIYTPGSASGHQIYVALIDPSGRRLALEPSITGGGFCIFHLTNAMIGQWKVMTEFSTPDTFNTTVGVIDREFCVSTELAAPHIASVGESIEVGVTVSDNSEPCENVTLGMHLTKYEFAADTSEGEPRDIKAERCSNDNIIQKDTRCLIRAEDGRHTITLDDTAQPGIYTVEIAVEGSKKRTGERFTQMKMASIIVE